eukprot:44105-Chlamydomonas_euryale.AAC.4
MLRARPFKINQFLHGQHRPRGLDVIQLCVVVDAKGEALGEKLAPTCSAQRQGCGGLDGCSIACGVAGCREPALVKHKQHGNGAEVIVPLQAVALTCVNLHVMSPAATGGRVGRGPRV